MTDIEKTLFNIRLIRNVADSILREAYAKKIEVTYIPEEDEYVKDEFNKGHLTWKPF